MLITITLSNGDKGIINTDNVCSVFPNQAFNSYNIRFNDGTFCIIPKSSYDELLRTIQNKTEPTGYVPESRLGPQPESEEEEKKREEVIDKIIEKAKEILGHEHVVEPDLKYKRVNTIHGRGILDVEVDLEGNVVSVWYNCLALPFRQNVVSDERAKDMDRMYKDLKVSIEEIDFKHE